MNDPTGVAAAVKEVSLCADGQGREAVLIVFDVGVGVTPLAVCLRCARNLRDALNTCLDASTPQDSN